MDNSIEICVKEINASKVNDRKFNDRGQELSRTRPRVEYTRNALVARINNAQSNKVRQTFSSARTSRLPI